VFQLSIRTSSMSVRFFRLGPSSTCPWVLQLEPLRPSPGRLYLRLLSWRMAGRLSEHRRPSSLPSSLAIQVGHTDVQVLKRRSETSARILFNFHCGQRGRRSVKQNEASRRSNDDYCRDSSIVLCLAIITREEFCSKQSS